MISTREKKMLNSRLLSNNELKEDFILFSKSQEFLY